jgi:hypothetical protein
MIMVQYTSSSTEPFEFIQLQYSSLNIVSSQMLFIAILALGLWSFMAWFVKHVLLWIASKFGETERIWQTVKVTALVSGWFAVFLCAAFIFDNVSAGFVDSELFVIVIGLVSFGLEYLLGKVLLQRKR